MQKTITLPRNLSWKHLFYTRWIQWRGISFSFLLQYFLLSPLFSVLGVMICLHPYCPIGNGLASWQDVVNDARLKVRAGERGALLANLNAARLNVIGNPYAFQVQNQALLGRMLKWMPCLHTQINEPTSADAIVHLCEITLGARINSANLYNAFVIQNPSDLSKTFTVNAQLHMGVAGDISEALCSEVLTNEGLPELKLNDDGWPILAHGHISLNKGKMRQVKAFGDILIPCAPSNIIISVKTQTAKEGLCIQPI